MNDPQQDELAFEGHFDLERAFLQVGRLLKPRQHDRRVQAVFHCVGQVAGSRSCSVVELVFYLMFQLLDRVLGVPELLQVVVALENRGFRQWLALLGALPMDVRGAPATSDGIRVALEEQVAFVVNLLVLVEDKRVVCRC